jgi:hypothetical protein
METSDGSVFRVWQQRKRRQLPPYAVTALCDGERLAIDKWHLRYTVLKNTPLQTASRAWFYSKGGEGSGKRTVANFSVAAPKGNELDQVKNICDKTAPSPLSAPMVGKTATGWSSNI